MALVRSNSETIYNPSSLLHIFNSTLHNETTQKVFKVKGIYTAGNGISYEGIYFDNLKDETSDASMVLVVPALIRPQLIQNKIIECNVYLTKRVQPIGGRIDLQLNVVELLSGNSLSYVNTQLKSFDILRKKAEGGYKDVNGFIKSKIINGEPITVNILLGKSGIIDSDIKHQLQAAAPSYKIYFIGINLTSEREIMESLRYYAKKCDILAVAAGGEENIEIFDSGDIAETALALSTHFITGLGDKENVPLLQKIADKSFTTPVAIGQYFNEIYNNTITDFHTLKAKLVNDITRQLEEKYAEEINNLNTDITSIVTSNKTELEILTRQLEAASKEKISQADEIKTLQQRMEKAGKKSVYVILLIIAALVIGCVIGRIYL
ncbi:exodeoxyribonuclease VII large subunit [Segetibacter koreensis]|uniref:exodeoxyribonuclease VII large subunit n=1 Tax=Segetibacter koreensis TaxID=398037 RepID=UPI00035F4681|nr:exodeoxyribonuclease VII large subunit [Segetibacter koreensis]